MAHGPWHMAQIDTNDWIAKKPPLHLTIVEDAAPCELSIANVFF
jgi:hypothetical protein